MSIPVVNSLMAANKRDSTAVQYYNVDDALSLFREGKTYYEITWAKDKADHCRAYIDIDGKVDMDYDEYAFKNIDESIKRHLFSIDFGTPCSIMTASKYNNVDTERKVSNKLSYRLTFTNKCGSLDAVKHWTQRVIGPMLKEHLAGVIPFYIKGLETIPQDAADYLDYDYAVYRCPGKMRTIWSNKPDEKRPNVMVKGEPIDTLINYIPEGCEVLPDPVEVTRPVKYERITPHETTVEPVSKELNAEKKLIVSVLRALPGALADDYSIWLSIGMACHNEDIPCEYWDEWSKKSKKYNAGGCDAKWRSFKRGNISQAYLWSLLKAHNIQKFSELCSERKDFERLICDPGNATVAQYYFNMKPYDYLYDSKCGWFSITSNNVWENTTAIAGPPTLKTKLHRALNIERIAFENIISEKKKAAEQNGQTDLVKTLEEKAKQCLVFKKCIDNDSFQQSVINQLRSMYAGSREMLMLDRGVGTDKSIISIFDTNPNLFAFSDGLYDFTTRSFRPISPLDYITITTGYRMPKPNSAVREAIMKTLTGIWENEECRDYMLTLLATCLNGMRNAEVFSILTGRGGNGKGLLWELVQSAFGDYYYALPNTTLTKKIESCTAATPDIAYLRGKRCVGTTEPEGDERLQEGLIKQLTGGDLITARPLYGQPSTFKPQFGLFIQCNTIPSFNQMTKGGVRRNRVIPFPLNFVEEPRMSYDRKGDPYIKNVLCKSDEWRDEFINILFSYYDRAAGKPIDAIPTPAMVVEKTNEYLDENNKVGTWWSANYEPCEGSFILSTDALSDFKSMTGDRMTDKTFKVAMAFNDIDIKACNKRCEYRGRMGIMNWKKKEVQVVGVVEGGRGW